MQRCLPVSDATYVVSGFYSDSGCTIPLAAVSTQNGCVPTYLETFKSSGCPAVASYELFATGAPFVGDVYDGSPSSCTKLSSPPSGEILYSVGAEIDPTEFVPGTPMVE
jgi:hypothetical protein